MKLLKNFLRSFSANRQSYVINMLSLIPGLACCLLILVWIVSEMGTDRCFPKIDRIVTVRGYHEGLNPFGGAPPAVAPTVKSEMPEVEAAARFCYAYETVKYEKEKQNITSRYIDADVFRIFDLKFTDGVSFSDDEVDKCVLSQKTAVSLFGTASPVGKTLEFENRSYTVCGVMEDLPKNTVGAQIYLPITSRGEGLDAWYNNSFQTYVLLKDIGQYDDFARKIKDRAMQTAPQNKLYLKAGLLKDRYLVEWGRMKFVKIVGAIALFILLIACINFINLATASFAKNSFQTGIRKVIGATRRGLLIHNLLNTFLLVLLSSGVALLLAFGLLPWFNILMGRGFVPSDFVAPLILGISAGVIVVTTLLAGFYPALFVSSFKPAKVLKGHQTIGVGKGGSWFRSTLVIVQFTIAVTLIVCTTVISKQIRMFQQMNLGYDKEEVMYVNLKEELKKNATILKAELEKEPAVVAVSLSQNVPTQINWNGTGWSWEGMDPEGSPLITFSYVDENWGKVLGVHFREGQFFSKDGGGVVINQQLADMMGGTTWVDRYINRGKNMKIIGVLDNFLFNDFREEIPPLVIMPLTPEQVGMGGCLMVRVEGNGLSEVHDMLKTKAKELNGGEAVSVNFLNDDVEWMLDAEKQSTRMVSFFSVLAIVISCLGLFGLATFMMEQKRKEIGIRRVNGAKVGEIVWLLNVNFIKPVIVAFILACPISYYVMTLWLESYMQRTPISWWIFVLAGIITLAIAIVTLVWRSVKAATENPVNSLKSE